MEEVRGEGRSVDDFRMRTWDLGPRPLSPEFQGQRFGVERCVAWGEGLEASGRKRLEYSVGFEF